MIDEILNDQDFMDLLEEFRPKFMKQCRQLVRKLNRQGSHMNEAEDLFSCGVMKAYDRWAKDPNNTKTYFLKNLIQGAMDEFNRESSKKFIEREYKRHKKASIKSTVYKIEEE